MCYPLIKARKTNWKEPDMTKMSAKMVEAYNEIVGKTNAAKGKNFAEWYSGSFEAYEEMLFRRVAKIGEKRTRMFLESAHKRYDLACNGIVSVDASYGTIKALVSRGLIETVNVYGLAGYAVRLVEE